MRTLFTLLLIFVHLCLQAQVKQEKKYLLVRFFYDYDKIAPRVFYKIIPDGWCEGANEIYGLKQYNPNRNAVNNDAAFYFERADTTKILYNYFRSPTEAFNFMKANGWTVVMSFPDNSDNGEAQPNSMVSRQVFCFYKE